MIFLQGGVALDAVLQKKQFFLDSVLTVCKKNGNIYIVAGEQRNRIKFLLFKRGELSEWLKEHAWKACVR